jgi:hypothetical protein
VCWSLHLFGTRSLARVKAFIGVMTKPVCWTYHATGTLDMSYYFGLMTWLVSRTDSEAGRLDLSRGRYIGLMTRPVSWTYREVGTSD